jgi:hypothetical protein
MAFFPAVMVAAFYGGLRPGLLATLLGAVAANVVFTEPHYALRVNSRDAAIALPLFLLVGAMMSGLAGSLHRARRHLSRGGNSLTMRALPVPGSPKVSHLLVGVRRTESDVYTDWYGEFVAWFKAG